MGNINNIRRGISKVLKQEQTDHDFADLLRELANMDKDKLALIKPLIEVITREGYDLQMLKENDEDFVSETFNHLATLIELLASKDIPRSFIHELVYKQNGIKSAMQYLPEEWRESLVVRGSVQLMNRYCRNRPFDLANNVIRWRDRLGKPQAEYSGLLEKYPYLTKVIFNSHIKISDPDFFYQFFGRYPALKHLKNLRPDLKKLITQISNKCPFKDEFALCPLPNSSIDNAGEELWFNSMSWENKLIELTRLQHRFSNIVIRLATIPEIIYLDWSMRLSTLTSPVGISSFYNQHPLIQKKCLGYGGVDDCGGGFDIYDIDKISYGRVLPLFIIKPEPLKKK